MTTALCLILKMSSYFKGLELPAPAAPNPTVTQPGLRLSATVKRLPLAPHPVQTAYSPF